MVTTESEIAEGAAVNAALALLEFGDYLQCADFWSAAAMTKPPRNRKMTGLAYGAAARSMGMRSSKGSSSNGRRAVADSGIASVIHHVAMSTAIADTFHAAGSMASGGGAAKTIAPKMSPRNKPSRFRATALGS